MRFATVTPAVDEDYECGALWDLHINTYAHVKQVKQMVWQR